MQTHIGQYNLSDDLYYDNHHRLLRACGWDGAEHRALRADALTRSYTRLSKGSRTAILLHVKPADEDLREFVAVARWLTGVGLSAPRIFAEAIEHGLLLLEDLGSYHFTATGTSPGRQEALYRHAIDAILHGQLCSKARQGAGLLDVLPRLDPVRLTAELDVFLEWYVRPLHAGFVPQQLVRAFRDAWEGALSSLAAPSVFVHADYHGDNLLKINTRRGVGSVGILDFQNAAFGHPAYDVVSLLDDTRNDLDGAVRDRLRRRYIAAATGLALVGTQEELDLGLALLGTQRNLRIIGVVSRLAQRDGKKRYLGAIPRSWRHIAERAQHPALASIHHVLSELVPPPSRGISPCKQAGGSDMTLISRVPLASADLQPRSFAHFENGGQDTSGDPPNGSAVSECLDASPPRELSLSPASEAQHRFDYLTKLFGTRVREGLNAFVEDRLENPLIVDFDPTTACNFSCPECISADLLNKEKIPGDRIRELMAEFARAGVKGIIFIGGGEPLAHSCMPEPIRLAHDYGIAVGLTTNGSLIDRHMDALASCVSWTRVSMDAGSEPVFLTFRPNKIKNSFNKIIDAMGRLAKRKQGTLGYSFLIMQRQVGDSFVTNAGDLYQAAKIAKDIGCDYFEFKPMFNMQHELLAFQQQVSEIIEEQGALCRALADDNFRVVSTYSLGLVQEERLSQPKSYHTCPTMALRTLVTPSGIYPCAYLRGRQDKLLGTVNDGPFDVFWKSEARHDAMKKTDPNVNCTFYCARHKVNLVSHALRDLHTQGVDLLPHLKSENLQDVFF